MKQLNILILVTLVELHVQQVNLPSGAYKVVSSNIKGNDRKQDTIYPSLPSNPLTTTLVPSSSLSKTVTLPKDNYKTPTIIQPSSTGILQMLGLRMKNNQPDKNRKKNNKQSNPFADMLFGIFLFIFSIPLMFFGERRAVRTKEQIEQAFKVCTHVIDNSNIDSLINNQLIFVEGLARVDQTPRDQHVNCEFTNTVRLVREVEVLQYQKEVNNRSGGDNQDQQEVSYNKEWLSYKVNSNTFDSNYNKNPQQWLLENNTQLADPVRLNQFTLDEEFIQQIQQNTIFALTPHHLNPSSKQQWEHQGKQVEVKDNWIYIKQAQDNQVGDHRIRYRQYQVDHLSVVGQYYQGTIRSYDITKYKLKPISLQNQQIPGAPIQDIEKQQLLGNQLQQQEEEEELLGGDNQITCMNCCCVCCTIADKCCATPTQIAWLHEGRMTKTQLFQSKLASNNNMTWLLRVGSALLMYMGLVLLLSPFTYLLSYIPLLGAFVNALLYIAAFIFTILVASAVMATAYVFYRPLYAAAVFVALVTFLILTYMSVDQQAIHTAIDQHQATTLNAF